MKGTCEQIPFHFFLKFMMLTVAGVKEDIAAGKVANFPDHYYPSGFDMSALLTEMCLNYTNGMDNEENINQFLAQCDEKYDIANVD